MTRGTPSTAVFFRGLAAPDVRRLWALSTLLRPLARQGFFSRAGRLYPWGIALGHLVLFFLARGREGVPLAGALSAALRMMSLAAGAVALGAAKELASDPAAPGLLALASERGLPGSQQRLGRAVATMRVVTRAIAVPGVALAASAAACAPEGRRVLLGVLLASSVVAYAVVFGVVFGGLARAAAARAPRHGRWLFLLVVLGPYLLSFASESGQRVPNLVDGFAALLRLFAQLGRITG